MTKLPSAFLCVHWTFLRACILILRQAEQCHDNFLTDDNYSNRQTSTNSSAKIN